MSNYDMDQLMGTYADWIAWLKEKEASLEGQLARMKGKEKEAARSEPVAEAAPVVVDDSTPDTQGADSKAGETLPPGEEDAEDWL